MVTFLEGAGQFHVPPSVSLLGRMVTMAFAVAVWTLYQNPEIRPSTLFLRCEQAALLGSILGNIYELLFACSVVPLG